MKRFLEVSGYGAAYQAADQVEIDLSLVSRHRDYAATLAGSANQMNALKELLAQLGFAPDIIQTRNYRLNTQYSQNPEHPNYQTVFDGYRLEHDLVMRFEHDDQLLSKLLSRLAQLEEQPEFSLSFQVKEPEKAEFLALERAVEDAKRNAQALAKFSGVELGEILQVTPSGQNNYAYHKAFTAERRSLDMQFPAGERVVNQQVTMRFNILA